MNFKENPMEHQPPVDIKSKATASATESSSSRRIKSAAPSPTAEFTPEQAYLPVNFQSETTHPAEFSVTLAAVITGDEGTTFVKVTDKLYQAMGPDGKAHPIFVHADSLQQVIPVKAENMKPMFPSVTSSQPVKEKMM